MRKLKNKSKFLRPKLMNINYNMRDSRENKRVAIKSKSILSEVSMTMKKLVWKRESLKKRNKPILAITN